MEAEVLIAGGGFAGAYAARELARRLGRAEGEARVAILAERNVLVFQPMLPEVAGSALAPLDVVNPLRQFCRGVVVLQGAIQKVDWGAKTVLVDGGRFTRNHTVAFRHLVLALGSVTDFSRVPGLREYGRPMKSVADALRLRAALINRLEEANLTDEPEVKRRLLTIVVVGGGYTGVETAGQIHDFLVGARRSYVRLRGTPVRVVLVHSRERLLPEIGPALGEYAAKVLRRNGVEVVLGRRVVEVTAARVVLDAGEAVEAHTVVSTVGNAPHPVITDLARQLSLSLDGGRVKVTPTLAVEGVEGLWAAGDCASVPWSDRGVVKTAPPTAQFALRQGKRLGGNLAAVMAGRQPQPFEFTYQGQLATIGRREAVAEVFGVRFSGFLAWWMWRTVYLGKLPGVVRKLRVVMDWTLELVFPRDTSVLQPPPDEDVRPIHLEDGEALYVSGDSCRGAFYLRRGRLRRTRPGGATEDLESGAVIEPLGSPEGRWEESVHAVGGADVLVFRGAMLELMRKDLRLVRREGGEGTADDTDGTDGGPSGACGRGFKTPKVRDAYGTSEHRPSG